MNRREFLKRVAAGALGVALGPRSASAAEGPQPPNLITVLIDDLGWRDVGFAGNTFVETPNLDRLARSGVIFSQAYAAAPNCAPTRACLMTGQYTPRHGVYTVVDDRHRPGMPHHRILASESKPEMDTDTHTIAEALRHHGYATGMVGMWNLGRGRRGPCTPTGQGFGTYVQPKDLGFERDAYHNAEGDYLTDKMTQSGLDFVRRHKEKPFFLYLAYHAIHAPFDPKPELVAKYSKKAGGRDADAAYAAAVESVDQNIGRLWALLESLGLTDNTYLLFTSDNGGMHQHTAPLRGGKGSLYEGGIRVPAFAVGPRVRPGQTSDAPISSIDIFPTLVDLAGAKAPPVDGESLVPMMTLGKPLPRNALFWHFPCYAGRGRPASAIRVGRHKLIESFEAQSIELYDLADDPGEERELSKTQPERARGLYKELKAWQAETKAPCPTAPNPDYDPSARRPRGREGSGKGSGKKEKNR